MGGLFLQVVPFVNKIAIVGQGLFHYFHVRRLTGFHENDQALTFDFLIGGRMANDFVAVVNVGESGADTVPNQRTDDIRPIS